MKFFNCFKNKKAQIVLPAILLIPTILLVIYLLFETAKLSRFKIRSQFALDSAAFIELTTYSNFLNAVAYVNGAFPYRVFRENMAYKINKEDDDQSNYPDQISYYDLFYSAGAFPAMGEKNTEDPKDDAGRWELKYKEGAEKPEEFADGKGRPKSWNTENPQVEDDKPYGINNKEFVEHYKYTFKSGEGEEDKENGIFAPLTLYIAVYKMFENIFENQKKVYERLTEGGEFFRKSYYYNSSSCKMSQCGKEGVRILQNYKLGFETVRLNQMNWFWRNENETDASQLVLKADNPKHQKFMPLYQFSYLDKNSRSKLKKMYTGIDIREPIIPPDNYFRVNVKKYAQKLHVRAALKCTNESNNCIWPNPTPKYQVRLYP